MSLPQLLAGVLDKHGDSMQQAALLAYLRQGEDAQQYLEVCVLQMYAIDYQMIVNLTISALLI